MADIEILNKSNITDYETLVDADRVPFLKEFNSENNAGVGARYEKKAVGIIVGRIINQENGDRIATIFSFNVDPAHQNKGVEIKLLKQIEHELKNRDCLKIYLNYKENGRKSDFKKRAIKKCGWERSQHGGTSLGTDVDKFFNKLPWTNPSKKYHYGTGIFPWTEITPEEFKKVQKEEGIEYGGRADSPLMWDEKKVETINSLGMRYKGEFVGWMVTHRVEPDTINYTSLFITKKYRKLGFAIPLIIESVKLQKKSGIPKLTWWVQSKAEDNLKWYNKLFKPCITTVDEYRYSVKVLKEEKASSA